MKNLENKNRNVAYKRVSTTQQEFHRQLADTTIVFDAEFSDKLSGADANRPQLQACLDYLEEGDTLYCHEISRLARNVEDLREIVFGLMERGVSVKFLKEGLEFVPESGDFMKGTISKMLLTLLGSVAEFERALINNRIKEGVDAAKKRGVRFGGASDKWKESMEKNKHLHKNAITKEKCRQEREPITKTIKDMIDYSNNSLTLAQIASKLNSRGITTVRGKSFSEASVSRIIKQDNIAYNRKHKHDTTRQERV